MNKVIFPPDHDPRVSALYALNDIDVAAPPEVVWRLLVDATKWSSYFPPENQITILGEEKVLGQGTRFTRFTVGHVMRCVVTESEPLRRLSWSTTVDGDATGSSAFHGWVITPMGQGCHVSTEETLNGEFFLGLIGRQHPGALYQYHQDWVGNLFLPTPLGPLLPVRFRP